MVVLSKQRRCENMSSEENEADSSSSCCGEDTNNNSTSSCASCGIAEVDDVNLKECSACDLVKYCSVDF